MAVKDITLHFDLDDEIQKKVYYSLRNLPEFYSDPDLSKAIIMFINNLVGSMVECEGRTVRCQTLLKSLLGKQALGRIEWQ